MPVALTSASTKARSSAPPHDAYVRALNGLLLPRLLGLLEVQMHANLNRPICCISRSRSIWSSAVRGRWTRIW